MNTLIKSSKRKHTFKRSVGEKILYIVVFTVFLIYALSLLYPILFLMLNSLRTSLEYYEMIGGEIGIFSLPKNWKFDNYVLAFKELKITDSFGREIALAEMFFNSVWYSILVVGEGVLASSFTAYCLSKFDFKLKPLLSGIAIVTMTLPIIGNTGSMFKLTSELMIYNTPFYVLFTAFNGFGFSYLILYGFFKNISNSYAEAVFIDGGGQFTAFFRVMLPQALAPLVTLCVINLIGAVNDYQTVLMFLPDYSTLASGLYKLQLTFTRRANMPAYFAALLIAIIPIIVLFVSFSDKIMHNFTMGGLKG